MDPVTLIVTALATGAASGLTGTATQAVKDAYAGIKAFIQKKYSSVNITPLEKKPDSEAKRASTAEDLAEAGANDDAELLELAKALLDTIKKHDRQAGEAIGVDLDEVEAEFLKIQKVRASGTGVKVRKSKFKGGIDVGEVDAGSRDNTPKA